MCDSKGWHLVTTSLVLPQQRGHLSYPPNLYFLIFQKRPRYTRPSIKKPFYFTTIVGYKHLYIIKERVPSIAVIIPIRHLFFHCSTFVNFCSLFFSFQKRFKIIREIVIEQIPITALIILIIAVHSIFHITQFQNLIYPTRASPGARCGQVPFLIEVKQVNAAINYPQN